MVNNRHMRLGEKLQRLRAGRSYAEVARAGKCSPPTIRDIEAGRTETPSFFLIARLSSFFDVSIKWLADETADWPPPKTPEQSAEDLVRNALADAGLAGELNGTERNILRLYRSMRPGLKKKVEGILFGMNISGDQENEQE